MIARDIALLTDLSELTTAASYLREGMNEPATFSLFVRKLLPSRSFLVAAGLESVPAYLEGTVVFPGEPRLELTAPLIEAPACSPPADGRWSTSACAARMASTPA